MTGICRKTIKAKKKLKEEMRTDKNKSNEKKQILTPNNLKTEDDLISFLQPKSYPGMDKLKWKMLKKNVRKFLVDLNNGDKSISKKKKLKMVFRKIREWTK